MANIILSPGMEPAQKVRLMQQDASFDVSEGDVAAGQAEAIRQSIRSTPALPKVPKVFLGNDCIFNCAYCGCRQSNECKSRYASTPVELAELAYRQARQGGHGIFLTSAILKNPDYTQELIIQTMRILRRQMHYHGYLHAKVMPGTDPELIRTSGLYADRLSVNIEVARSEGYAQIAHNKNKHNILAPMEQISTLIAQARTERSACAPRFATSQTTQLMAGSTDEDDFVILNLSAALYKKYHLSRVYYTAFQYIHPADGYDYLKPKRTPIWRMTRLYQADRLMQQYGFAPDEIAPPKARYLSADIEPKAAWALRNLHRFPVEVNTADYEMLLRIPGIGITSAQRILHARREGRLTHDTLRALGVRMRRSRHFITCAGHYEGLTCEHADALFPLLCEAPRQLSLFDPETDTRAQDAFVSAEC